MTDITERRSALLARLQELDVRLHGIEAELDSHQSKDWEDLAVEREEDEVLEGMGEAGLAEIKTIRAALERMRADSYGFCVKCGDEVQSARLDVLPATPFCATCAQ